MTRSKKKKCEIKAVEARFNTEDESVGDDHEHHFRHILTYQRIFGHLTVQLIDLLGFVSVTEFGRCDL